MFLVFMKCFWILKAFMKAKVTFTRLFTEVFKIVLMWYKQLLIIYLSVGSYY